MDKYAFSRRPINSTSRHRPQPLKGRLPSQAKVERGATNSDETICVWNRQDQTGRGNEDTVTDLDKRNRSKAGDCHCCAMLVPQMQRGMQ